MVSRRSLQIFWNPNMKFFAYGLHTNIDHMADRCPGSSIIGLAWIDDHEFVFRSHANIDVKAGARCYGILWEIDLRNLQSLDASEDFPRYYTRFNVRVNTGKYIVPALVYQLVDQTSPMAQPRQAYLDIVTKGYQQNGMRMDQLQRAINMICSTSNVIGTA